MEFLVLFVFNSIFVFSKARNKFITVQQPAELFLIASPLI